MWTWMVCVSSFRTISIRKVKGQRHCDIIILCWKLYNSIDLWCEFKGGGFMVPGRTLQYRLQYCQRSDWDLGWGGGVLYDDMSWYTVWDFGHCFIGKRLFSLLYLLSAEGSNHSSQQSWFQTWCSFEMERTAHLYSRWGSESLISCWLSTVLELFSLMFIVLCSFVSSVSATVSVLRSVSFLLN